MSEPTMLDLQRLAREVFGREISEAQAEVYRARLPAMARAVAIIKAWQQSLDAVEPAPVHRVTERREDGDGAG